jgi:serine acetyltransferase
MLDRALRWITVQVGLRHRGWVTIGDRSGLGRNTVVMTDVPAKEMVYVDRPRMTMTESGCAVTRDPTSRPKRKAHPDSQKYAEMTDGSR